MGFESCHPAVNFLFFAAALYGAVRSGDRLCQRLCLQRQALRKTGGGC